MEHFERSRTFLKSNIKHISHISHLTLVFHSQLDLSQHMSKPVIRIGTRESQLALWQANYVKQLMSEAHPDIEFQIIGMTTMGDNDLIKPLSSFDSKGVFTKELDIALANNAIDIAVHCMKDLATVLPEGQEFFATMDRGAVEDAVILNPKYVDAYRAKAREVGESKTSIALDLLPEGAIIGTSALRRQVWLGP